jgi:protein TonB
MFETSTVRARTQAAGGRLTLLTVSLIAHSAVIIGAIAFSIASVDFPTTAPDAYELAPVFSAIQPPPPLGTPNARPAQAQQPRPATPPPAAPSQITAPPAIPDTITPVDASSTGPVDPTATTTGEIGTPGQPWGVKDSIGEIDAPPSVPSSPPAVEERIYQPSEVKAPVLIRKVEPVYPPIYVRVGVPSTVILRCVIDKNGHVRSQEILKSGRTPFDEAVIAAVQQWRYAPASLRGIAVDSYLDVTVRFEVRR